MRRDAFYPFSHTCSDVMHACRMCSACHECAGAGACAGPAEYSEPQWSVVMLSLSTAQERRGVQSYEAHARTESRSSIQRPRVL